MSYEHLRRSTRIPKELAILLTGSDTDGKGFSEMTKTVLLSRHGAGIVSSYKLSAEQEIILRYLDMNKEAVVRVVGRIGSEGDFYTYGVAFVDSSMVDFWGADFAPVSDSEKLARRVNLECSLCQLRETVEHSDVESDVFLINEGIVRYCKVCHDSTLWRRGSGQPEEEPALVGTVKNNAASSFAGATSAASTPVVEELARASGFESMEDERPVPAAGKPAPTAELPATPKSTLAPPLQPENRRKHPRTKVTYKACIRRSGFTDDVVTCEDMSRGGICFKSRKRYFENIDIEVAVPYSPGSNTIFVPARIAWVVELTKDKLFKCGVAYRIASRAS